MFSLSRKMQSVVCMILSAAIISLSLSLGAFAADRAAQRGFSVTITELQ